MYVKWGALSSSKTAVFATHPGKGDKTSRLWQGCHNSAAPHKAHAAGFHLKSVGGREQVSLTPVLSLRLGVPTPGFRIYVYRSDSFYQPSFFAIVLAAYPISLVLQPHRFFTCFIVYSIFKEQVKKISFYIPWQNKGLSVGTKNIFLNIFRCLINHEQCFP